MKAIISFLKKYFSETPKMAEKGYPDRKYDGKAYRAYIIYPDNSSRRI